MFNKRKKEIEDLKWVNAALQRTIEELKEEIRELEKTVCKLQEGQVFNIDPMNKPFDPCDNCEYRYKPWHGIVSPCQTCIRKSSTGGYVTTTSTSVTVEKE